MEKILFVFFGVYFACSILFFVFITYKEKKDNEEKEPLYVKIITSLALSLILTLVLMFFIFIVFGAGNLVGFIFSIELDIKQLLFIAVIIVGYSLLADHLVFTAVKYIFKNIFLSLAIISVVRFVFFVLVGSFFSFGDTTIGMLAFGFILLFLLVDIYNLMLKEKEQ